jgi:hypothetical protein
MTISEIQRKRRNTTHTLRKSRGERQHVDWVRYYYIPLALSTMTEPHRQIVEKMLRDLGVLRPDGTVAE